MKIYTAEWRKTVARMIEWCALLYGLGAVACLLAATRPAEVWPTLLWFLSGMFVLGAVILLRCARDIRK